MNKFDNPNGDENNRKVVLLKRDMTKWQKSCKFSYEDFRRYRDVWHTYDHEEVAHRASQYYANVFYAGPGNKSGLISLAAMHLPSNKVTNDHWASPRMNIRAIMDKNPEILDDYDEWEDNFRNFAMSTIALTSEENGIVKFQSKNGKIKINYLTIDKYNLCENKDGVRGIKFYDENKNNISPDGIFPLAHLIPPWFTKFEKQFLDNGRTLEEHFA